MKPDDLRVTRRLQKPALYSANHCPTRKGGNYMDYGIALIMEYVGKSYRSTRLNWINFGSRNRIKLNLPKDRDRKSWVQDHGKPNC